MFGIRGSQVHVTMSSPLSGMRSDRTDPFHRHCRMQVIVVHVSGICQGSFPIPALILLSTKFCGIFIHFLHPVSVYLSTP